MRIKAGSWLLSKQLKRFKQETGARAFNEGWRKRKKEAVEGFDVALTRCWVSTHLFCHVVSLTHSKCLYSKFILHELQISGSREAYTLYIGGYVPAGAREGNVTTEAIKFLHLDRGGLLLLHSHLLPSERNSNF